MGRAVNAKQLANMQFEVLDFWGSWEKLIGKPEVRGAWIIWGASGNGKTRFALQLAKYLAGFGRVLYNSREEGISESLKRSIIEEKLTEVGNNFLVVDETYQEMIDRLKKRKSPKFVIIDSLQYLNITYRQYQRLKEIFPKKLFIWISHADGKEPLGPTAKKVRYDSNVKIRIEGFKAFAQSRYGGGEPYVIWEEKAKEIWVE